MGGSLASFAVDVYNDGGGRRAERMGRKDDASFRHAGNCSTIELRASALRSYTPRGRTSVNAPSRSAAALHRKVENPSTVVTRAAVTVPGTTAVTVPDSPLTTRSVPVTPCPSWTQMPSCDAAVGACPEVG